MSGKVCMVVGGTGGIGKATAMGLAGMGATVIVVSRGQDEGEAAVAEIKAHSGNEAVEWMGADLAVQASMRDLVRRFKEKYQRLDVLVHSAHTFFRERKVSEDGTELIFGVTYLSLFTLSNLLLDVLKASAPSRIVVVADDIRLISRTRIDFDNLQGEKHYDPVHIHNQAKLAEFYFAHEFARRLQGSGVTINCLYPGHVDTGMKGDVPWFVPYIYPLFKHLHIAATPEQGAQTPLYLAVAPEVQDISGGYFKDKAEARSTWDSYDETVSQHLWQVSSELAGIDA
jgi:NAD(P)-dependent dehydrogenase (short-subunit alcohol dehydrogenase family)